MDPSPGEYRLELAKENFKFSVAHFTVFSATEAELLHGHNYQVAVEVRGRGLDSMGLLADVARLKGEIRRLCDELDSHTLIPTENPLVHVERAAGSVEVRYGARRYVLPEADVLLLPVINSSMEQFAYLLWSRLAPFLAATHLHYLAVAVGETSGQRCVYGAELPAA
jgi:6-pyruvoyltetrahydropterin/6-carboxytetrahydropterin synthase